MCMVQFFRCACGYQPSAYLNRVDMKRSAFSATLALILLSLVCLDSGKGSCLAFSPVHVLSKTVSSRDIFSAPKHALSSSTRITFRYKPNDEGENENVSLFSMINRNMFAIAAAALILFSSIEVVDTGEIAIVSKLGALSQLNPGLHVVAPLISRVDKLSTKTTLLEQSNFVPTKEGLTVELDTAILFRLASDSATSLFGSVGKEYVNKLIAPEASSAVRGLTSESEAKALYTSGRSEIQNKLKTELTQNLSPRGIVIEDVLLKAVILPKDLSASIEEKARAEQESARMEFVLKKETQEAQRKAIEAEGIAEFQNIVSKGITPSLLQWNGIEATEKIAESPNSKVVIIGNNKDSLPVILGNDGKK